ncbi:MAG: LEA type 2 family protein [Bacteroidales bacterium]
MRLFNFLFVILPVLFLASCVNLENIEVGEIEDVSFSKFANKTIEFEVLMPIDNPSGFRFRITDVDLDVYINNEYMGKIRNVDNVLIPSRSSELYTFPLKVEFSNILKGAMSMFNFYLDRQAEVEIKGSIGVRSFPVSRSIKVNEKTSIRLD